MGSHRATASGAVISEVLVRKEEREKQWEGKCGSVWEKKNKSFRTHSSNRSTELPSGHDFRQTERECVNKNHGYMAYSLCPSVLTSQEITDSPERGSMPCVNSQLFCFRIIEVEERSAYTILWD